jgi:hypothetical protein
MTIRELMAVLGKCEPDRPVLAGPGPKDNDRTALAYAAHRQPNGAVYLSLEWMALATDPTTAADESQSVNQTAP